MHGGYDGEAVRGCDVKMQRLRYLIPSVALAAGRRLRHELMASPVTHSVCVSVCACHLRIALSAVAQEQGRRQIREE